MTPTTREAQFRSIGWIEDLHRLQVRLEDDIAQAVEAARLQRVPWAEIGKALGVTKQAARQRYFQPRDQSG